MKKNLLIFFIISILLCLSSCQKCSKQTFITKDEINKLMNNYEINFFIKNTVENSNDEKINNFYLLNTTEYSYLQQNENVPILYDKTINLDYLISLSQKTKQLTNQEIIASFIDKVLYDYLGYPLTIDTSLYESKGTEVINNITCNKYEAKINKKGDYTSTFYIDQVTKLCLKFIYTNNTSDQKETTIFEVLSLNFNPDISENYLQYEDIFKFKDKTTLTNNLTNFSVILKVNDNDTETFYDFKEDSRFIYCKTNNNLPVFYDKTTRKTYILDLTNKTKSEYSLPTDFINISNKIKNNYLTNHLTMNKESYHYQGHETINSYDCQKYYLYAKNDVKEVESYYLIDNELGYCIKSYYYIQDVTITTLSVEAINLSIGDIELSQYFLFTDTIFNGWPNEGLGLLLPKFTEGSYIYHTISDNEFEISYEVTTNTAFTTYIESIKNAGYIIDVVEYSDETTRIYQGYNNEGYYVKIVETDQVINISFIKEEKLD